MKLIAFTCEEAAGAKRQARQWVEEMAIWQAIQCYLNDHDLAAVLAHAVRARHRELACRGPCHRSRLRQQWRR